jgi:hypothetical protein
MAEINVNELIHLYYQEHKNDLELKGKSESEVASIMLSRGVLTEKEYQEYQKGSIFLSKNYYTSGCFDCFEVKDTPTNIGIYENYAMERLKQNTEHAKKIVSERDKEQGVISKFVNAGHELAAITEKKDIKSSVTKAAIPMYTLIANLFFNPENAKSRVETAILASQKDFEYLKRIA